MGKVIMRLASQVFVTAICTTVLLMVFLMKMDPDQEEVRDTVRELQAELKEYRRVDKLHKLQIFRNLNRPPDSKSQSIKNGIQLPLKRDAAELKEYRRVDKLHKLQRSIFKNLNRPPDSTYNINVTRAEMTPLERDIPDSRPKACRGLIYDTNLPTVSVVIPFYNEALAMLLRTAHSILMRTPETLLREIILVNDNSKNPDLDGPLEQYVSLMGSKVKLIKNTERIGLIRARLKGAAMTTGEVVVFLDAHTEANEGWAEPLLQEIKRNPESVVMPLVESVDQWTIDYIGGTDYVSRGGFKWSLQYVWTKIPTHERTRMAESAREVGGDVAREPFRTATLVGCVFAVQKKYFYHIGGLDEGMNVWGGENIELAMRVWMCGGQVLTVPCSRVGHVFKPFSYKFDGDKEKIVQKNLMRIAEVWMDDWKKFFYASTYIYDFKRTTLTEEERNSIAERKTLKQKLKCKSFLWYMVNVVPELSTPPVEAEYFGEIGNVKTNACFGLHEDGFVGLQFECFEHRVLPEHQYALMNDGTLKYRSKCIHIEFDTLFLKTVACDQIAHNVKWEFQNYHPVVGKLVVTHTNDIVKSPMCVAQVTNIIEPHQGLQMLQLQECEQGHQYQEWYWQYHFDFNYDFGNLDVI